MQHFQRSSLQSVHRLKTTAHVHVSAFSKSDWIILALRNSAKTRKDNEKSVLLIH